MAASRLRPAVAPRRRGLALQVDRRAGRARERHEPRQERCRRPSRRSSRNATSRSSAARRWRPSSRTRPAPATSRFAGIVAALGGRDADGRALRRPAVPAPGRARAAARRSAPGHPRGPLRRERHRGDRGDQRSRHLRLGGAADRGRPARGRHRPWRTPPRTARRREASGPRLYQSLYETAARHDLPRGAVDDLVRIFGYDIDFQRRISAGDSLDVFYTFDDEGAQGCRRAAGTALRLAQPRWRGPQGLPLPVPGRRNDRLPRRAGPIAQEVPHPQAHRRRHHALGLRLSAPPGPRLRQAAYRRRLVEPDRHADRGRRQRHRDQGGLGFRLRPPGRDCSTSTATSRPTTTCPASPAASPPAPRCARAR